MNVNPIAPIHSDRRCLRGALLTLGICAAPVYAGFDENMERWLELDGAGQIKFDLRYRYETVNQDPAVSSIKTNTAKADTVRLRLGYLTPTFQGLTGYAEYEGNQDIFVNDYSTVRQRSKKPFPIIADPQINELNQLWINYAGIPDTHIKAGRQRIIFDNHRFIGNVGWRQLEQTFDSVTIVNASLPKVVATAGYIFNVQDVNSQHETMDSPILNVAYNGFTYGTLVAYGYWLDYQDQVDSRNFLNSSKTYGIRFVGTAPLTDKLKAVYTAEYAHQQDYGKNPKKYEADYWLGEAGLSIYGITFKGSYEELGSDNGVGFSTPLATLHIFQGWADKFLVTPPDGIRDVYGTISGNLFGVDVAAVYHQFNDDTGSIHYGEEFDFLIEKKFGKHYSVLLKYADYHADRFATDTEKFWVQGAVNF